MAKDVPLGMEFMNWQNAGSGTVGQALGAGLMAYGMQKSGLTDWLNNLQKKPEQQTVVPGAVPLPASFDKYLSANQPTQSVQPVVPPAPGVAPMQQAVPEVPSLQQPTPEANPQQIGLDWLNGKLSKLGSTIGPMMG